METLYFYVLLLALAWSIFNRYVIPKMRNLPPTPFSPLTLMRYLCRNKHKPLHRTLSQIASQYGPILLLQFGCKRVLLVSSSSAAEELFAKNDLLFADRPKLITGKEFGCNYTSLASAPHDDHWLHLRCVSTLKILPFHRLPGPDGSVANEVKLLLGRLFCTKKKTVDLKSVFLDLVFDVMMKMFAGKRYAKKKKAADDDQLKDYAIHSFRITTKETDVGYFMPVLKFLGLIRGLERKCNKLQKQGDAAMDSLIEEVRKKIPEFSNGSGEKEEKVIEFLLARQKDEPKGYSDETIRGLLLVLLSAGTTTSASILEWAFSLLLNHPEVLHKAQSEIDNHVGNDRFLEESDIEHLPYLRCIVKETLRLYPTAPLLVPHESSEDCKVGGYHVPKETMLMVNVWAIQNDPNIWAEPTKFNPERFRKMVDERDGFKLMPFGYGRRSCPGKHMAVHVITLALGSLIHCFEWERISEEMVNLTEQTGLALLKEQPLMAKCSPRCTMEKLLRQV
ncbi:cytochrome P450-like protein [Artemisia annua]|uniref:Cytochrome P450-like protein n=2 Tax=Artemisia annua TaxID=35608 RepID=A0A2U1L711_ARTAN|nr:cytochrome P450-like protein [Artemisia annua]